MSGTDKPPQAGVELLSWKLDRLADDVHKISNSLMSGQVPSIVALEARIKAQEELSKETKATLLAINQKLDDRAKTPWAQWIAFAGLLWAVGGGIGGVCWTIMNKEIARVEQTLTQRLDQSGKNGDAIRLRLDRLEQQRSK